MASPYSPPPTAGDKAFGPTVRRSILEGEARSTTLMPPSWDHSHERRHDPRPHHGEHRKCRTCAGSSSFDERFRFEGELMPAWVCTNPECPRTIVRRVTSPPPTTESRDATRSAREVQARAKRTMMKSRSRKQRSQDRVAESQALVRTKN